MVTARLVYRPFAGLWLAGAFNYGGVDQLEDGEDVTALLYTLEARYAANGFDTGVSWGHGMIRDPQDLTTATDIPEAFTGLSVFAAYDVLRLMTESSHQLFVFGRYEDLDLQAEIPDGVAEDDAQRIEVIQYGLTYKPNPWVAIKADYRDMQDSNVEGGDSWNLGVAFAF